MVDTVRTQSELLSLFADNNTGDISAQDARDFIVSVHPDGGNQFSQTDADALYSLLGHTHTEADITDLGAYLENIVEDTTPQLGGTLDANGNPISMADQEIQRPVIDDYGIVSSSPASASGALTLDFENGNAFEVTLTEDITSITLSNPPASGTYGEMIVKFVQDATGSWTVGGWPAAVKWPTGAAPTITTTATTGTDIIVLRTWDAGTTYFGDFSQDYS